MDAVSGLLAGAAFGVGRALPAILAAFVAREEVIDRVLEGLEAKRVLVRQISALAVVLTRGGLPYSEQTGPGKTAPRTDSKVEVQLGIE
jgi:hypothetical protein